jgi:hypothetical protein
MNLPWLRLYTEIIDDEKLRLLAFEDRWHFVALLCCKGKGILDDADKALMRRKVAVKLGLDLKTLDEVARRLAEIGLIDEGNFQPLSWEKRQRISDHLDNTNAERQRRHRDRKRDTKIGVTESNARYVTKITAVDTDTDTDTDKDFISTKVDIKETPKGTINELSTVTKPSSATTKNKKSKNTDTPTLPDWLPAQTWEMFQSHRKSLRKPMTPGAETLMIKRIAELRAEGHDPVKVIELAISSGWSSIHGREDTKTKAPILSIVGSTASARCIR